MRTKLILSMVLALVLTSISISVVVAKQDKVAVCHKPGTEDEETLYLPARARDAHVGHGDYEGECEEPDLRSSVCQALDGYLIENFSVDGVLDATFVLGGNQLLASEIVEATVTNNTNKTQWTDVAILDADSATTRSVKSELFILSSGQTDTQTLANTNDPTGVATFKILIDNIDGSATGTMDFVFTCSLP